MMIVLLEAILTMQWFLKYRRDSFHRNFTMQRHEEKLGGGWEWAEQRIERIPLAGKTN